MKTICILITFLSSFLLLNSQTDILKSIKQDYYDIQKEIDAQKNEDIPQNNTKIVVNQMMPAIGCQTVEYDLYFYLNENEFDVSFDHSLWFATREYNVAQSMFVYEEFLYDGDGNLSFYFQIEKTETCKQLRCYFNENKLIKVIYKEGLLDADYGCGNYKIVLESENELPEDYKLGDILDRAKNIIKIHSLLDR